MTSQQKPSKDYLDYLSMQIRPYSDELKSAIKSCIDWYKSDQCPLQYRHKVFVIGRVVEFASMNGFVIQPIQIIGYSGDNGTQMMHYQFKVRRGQGSSAIPEQTKLDLIDILNQSVLNIDFQDFVGNERPIIDIGYKRRH